MRLVVGAVVLAGAVPVAGIAGEPSASCDRGEMPPGATPAEVGARQAGDPGDDPMSVSICVAGGAERPLKGAAKVTVTPDGSDGPYAIVVLDGDSGNAFLGCTDGFAAARVDGGGPHLYQGPDGSFTYLAKEKAPDAFARDVARDCWPDGPPIE